MPATLVLMLAGCPKNVPQASKSGEDATYKGAKEIKLENNEAKSRGIVTYPGGDRVDWKSLELPKDKIGSLKLTLAWKPPRPGLDLSFDVFNEWNHVVQSAKPNKARRSRKASKTVTVENAKGKYLIQIYASERGDAGRYTLTAEFAETGGADPFDWLKVEISDPPKLPAVPENVKPCDPATFDKKNPACVSVCPNPPDMSWPACAGSCPVPPDENIPKCLDTMPCPKDKPNRKFKMCKTTDFPKCSSKMTAEEREANPRCDGWKPPPTTAAITDVQDDGGGVLITIGVGLDKGIDKGFKGVLLDSDGREIRGTEFKVLRASKDASVARINRLTRDDVPATARARLTPP